MSRAKKQPAPVDTASDIQSLFKAQRPHGDPISEQLLVKLRPVLKEEPLSLVTEHIEKTMKREIVWEGKDRAWFRFGDNWTYLRWQWDEEEKYICCYRQIWKE